ncbi:uncharacterized protein EI97DRAFT_426358 [Westerdykella ornata]|uniref:Uncharacterized protein n=1 Tax=Westerdykella ornata TaxID=318751 RepID=A0A6A6J869_WESOR|nr:uncharacterized protein EI97DRAFT_426358 [Westerdykella ornata]KAF2272437.1 hypothetical protein EI97DRAFT_426358 [Westerdykella ornata]
MAIKYVSRIHAMGIVVRNPTWQTDRFQGLSEVRPRRGDTSPSPDTIYFVIPTPAMIDGDNMKAVSAAVRFRTGSSTRVTEFTVTHNSLVIIHKTGLSLSHSSMAVHDETVPGGVPVQHSVLLEVKVDFTGSGPDDFIELAYAEVSFDNI